MKRTDEDFKSLSTIMYEMLALEKDVIPSKDPNVIAAALAAMPPETARKMKRKFRKLWRSIMKKRIDAINEEVGKHRRPRKVAALKREFAVGHDRNLLESGDFGTFGIRRIVRVGARTRRHSVLLALRAEGDELLANLKFKEEKK